jgi:hypothetical protein
MAENQIQYLLDKNPQREKFSSFLSENLRHPDKPKTAFALAG